MNNSVNRPIRIPGKRLVLTERMIMRAIDNTKSNAEAARWIGVSFNTYKKYAKTYGLWEKHKNQAGVGVKKGWSTYKIPMEDIFKGRKVNYTISVLKRRLVNEGYMQEECSICGWNEERLLDGKICLNIDFLDGESDNKSYDNMRLLCPNCYLSNNGHFHNSKLFCK